MNINLGSITKIFTSNKKLFLVVIIMILVSLGVITTEQGQQFILNVLGAG